MKWTPIDRPRDVDHLGVYYGYVWYRIEIEQDKAGDRTLFLPECEDRASIFVNGQFAGIWGREPVIDPKHHKGATRTGLKAHFARGTNVLTVLLDNLGRINFSTRLGELKGLYGHIYEAGELGVKPGKPRPVENSARRVVPRKLLHLVNGLESQQQYEIPLDLSLRKMAPVHLSFSRLPYGQAALVCNGRIVNFWEGNFGDQTLRSELKKGRNEMSLVVWGKPPKPEDLEAIHLHELEADLTQEAKWSYRPWEMPGGKPLAAPAGAPAWFSATFKHRPAQTASGAALPLFVRIFGVGKGQIFINNHNAGRFWTIGPQEYYYLPECWLGENNELKLFVEHGEKPQIALEYRPRGPFIE